MNGINDSSAGERICDEFSMRYGRIRTHVGETPGLRSPLAFTTRSCDGNPWGTNRLYTSGRVVKAKGLETGGFSHAGTNTFVSQCKIHHTIESMRTAADPITDEKHIIPDHHIPGMPIPMVCTPPSLLLLAAVMETLRLARTRNPLLPSQLR